MMRPSFPGNFARASFQAPQPPLPNTPPPAFSHGTPPASAGGQFDGGGVSGWEGPAPALGVPVGGFNVQPEVLGLPAAALNGTIRNNNQPWANLRADSVAWRDGAFSSQVGLLPFASGSVPSANVRSPFQNDQANALHNSMYQSPNNNRQQGGHPTLPPGGTSMSFQVGHTHPHNHLPPYQNVPQGQCVTPFEMHQMGSSTPSEQQWPPSNLVNHIYTGVPLGNFCSNSLSLGAQQQWPLPETANHAPAGNFHRSSPCRPSGSQQQCPLPETANHIFTGVPVGNFNSSPCKPSGALQLCPLPETPNHVFNGVPAANFHGSLPCRPSGAPQQCPSPETSNHTFNGVAAGNLYTTPLCRLTMNSANCTNIEASVSHIRQNGSQQVLHPAVNNVKTVSVTSSCAPHTLSDSAGTPTKGQTNGRPMEALHMGTCKQQYDWGNNSWGRGRAENGNGMPHPQIRGGAGWRGGRNSPSNMVPAGRGGGWREKIGSGDSRLRVGAMPFKSEACDRTFSNRHQMNLHKVGHVKCGENGCNFEASGKQVNEHRLMMHSMKPALSASSRRAAMHLSKEGEEEIRRWREERRRNYPTTPNIQRKAQEALARKMRGELEDEDARKRKERLKEILARQAELGVPVAEIPAHYISDSKHIDSKRLQKKRGLMAQDSVNAKSETPEVARQNCNINLADTLRPAKMARRERGSRFNNQQPSEDVDVIASKSNDSPSSSDQALTVVKENATSLEGMTSLLQTCDTELKQDDVSQVVKSSSRKLDRPCYYFQRGRCKKGARCQFLHEKNRKKNQDSDKVGMPAEPGLLKREPTLLAKLLDGDIRKDKSHLLQCFRFFVNNSFLAEWPEVPLKFFSWADVELPSEFRESNVVAKSPESSNFSDVDSEEQLQSETSVLDEPNLQSVISNGCRPESEPFLEDGGGSETELESIDSENLWMEVKHRIMDDARVGKTIDRTSCPVAP